MNYWEYNPRNYWALNQLPVEVRELRRAYWVAPDTHENFLKNPVPGYTETSIIYQYNKHGFRTTDFELNSSKKSVLCLGCSFTEGIGLNSEQTWPDLLRPYFPDHMVYNLGVAGSSSDTVARLLTNVGSLLNTSHVFIVWPTVGRYETYSEKIASHWNHHHTEMYNKNTLIESHAYNAKMKNVAIVKLLQQIYQYQVIDIQSGLETPEWIDKARDGHPGPLWQQALARVLYKKYQGSGSDLSASII
jgi:hypothetical protein